MRNLRWATLLALLFSLVASGQQQPPQLPREGPPTSPLTQQEMLILLEQKTAQAVQKKEVGWLRASLAEDCLVIAPDGKLSTKADVLQVLPDITLENFSQKDFHVRMLGEDVAVVTYETAVRGTAKAQSFAQKAQATSLWRVEGHRWVLKLHQLTPILQPR